MKRIYLSKNANPVLQNYLKQQGWQLNIVEPTHAVYSEIAAHPDVYMCKLGCSDSSPVFSGKQKNLGMNYPANIIYNAACTGKYFIHNLKYSAPELLSEAHSKNMKFIDVPQGYTKCNTVIVDECSVITSDQGIKKGIEASGEQLQVLLIEKGYVKLPGFDYGFLGGASGRLGNTVLFNGNLSAHPDFDRIRSFIESRGLLLKYFETYPLEDIGSIICYSEKDL